MLEVGAVVCNDFKVVKVLGSGSFGIVYLVLNSNTSKEYAVKAEALNIPIPQLRHEARLLARLSGNHVPRIFKFNNDATNNYMVMECMGMNLESIRELCPQTFTHHTICTIAIKLLDAIEYVHSKGILHRDIKPENIVLGRAKSRHDIHFIDFGLAKEYMSMTTKAHIPYKDGKRLTGTARFASIKTHLGIEHSRRCDLESIGYVLIYLCKGSLPWQGIKCKIKDEKYSKIMEKKIAHPLEKLCEGVVPCMVTYLDYCRNNIQFDEKPDYAYLRQLFKEYLLPSKNPPYGWCPYLGCCTKRSPI